MPVAMEKVEGPATKLTFLGIQIDSVTFELSLPSEKLARTKQLVMSWQGKRAATKRQLLSLIGSLSHAASVMVPGRTFLRRLIDTAKMAHKLQHFVCINAVVPSDLKWWACFLDRWNGRSLIPPEEVSGHITSDASVSWGCGAYSSLHKWFQLAWPCSWASVHIAAKELVPIVIAVAVWGSQWVGQAVRVHSDNMAVVAALLAGTCRDELLMHLLRCLHFYQAHFQLRIRAVHVPGVQNVVADALSCNELLRFYSMVPQAAAEESVILQALVDMLRLH